LEVRNITEASYIVKFNRNDLLFKPGQYLAVGFPGTGQAREYSIYSGTEDKYLEILIREVSDGKVSMMLHKVQPGDKLEIRGPFGYFLYNIIPSGSKKLVFIASGTGIAPFHSFIRTFPDSDYEIIHGIKNSYETYEKEHYKPGKYTACTSQDKGGDFPGRLTDYLLKTAVAKDSMIFLCGNNNMIQDAMEILVNKGFSHSQLFTEVYF